MQLSFCFLFLFFSLLFQVGLLSVLQHFLIFHLLALPLKLGVNHYCNQIFRRSVLTLWLPACGALLPFSTPLDVTNIFVLHMHAVCSGAQGRRCECQLASASRLCFPLSFLLWGHELPERVQYQLKCVTHANRWNKQIHHCLSLKILLWYNSLQKSYILIRVLKKWTKYFFILQVFTFILLDNTLEPHLLLTVPEFVLHIGVLTQYESET